MTTKVAGLNNPVVGFDTSFRFQILLLPVLVYSSLASAQNLNKLKPLDFFIQDVCLDGAGQVIMGASPLSPQCASTRDLRPGELLPYQRVKYPGVTDATVLEGQMADANRNPAPAGSLWATMARFAAIPMKLSKGMGIGGVSIADQKAEGNVFWTFEIGPDAIHGPNVASKNAVYEAFGLDHSGPYRYVTSECDDRTSDPTAARDGNIWVELERGRIKARRGTHEGLPRKYVDASEPCPKFDKNDEGKNLVYQVKKLQFATGLKAVQEVTPPIDALIVHSATDVEESHVEVLFFTRQFGETRWEAWENLNHSTYAPAEREDMKRRAAQIIAEQQCSVPDSRPPIPGNWKRDDRLPYRPYEQDGEKWVLVGCRNVMTVIPAFNPQGDDPSVWREALARMELSAPLVGEKAADAPRMTSLRPRSGPRETEVTIRGKRFAPTGNMVFLERGCTVRGLDSSNNGTIIKFKIPKTCQKALLDHGEYELKVFNGEATSDNSITFTVTDSKGRAPDSDDKKDDRKNSGGRKNKKGDQAKGGRKKRNGKN